MVIKKNNNSYLLTIKNNKLVYIKKPFPYTIEDVHKNNFKIIKYYHLNEGDILKDKKYGSKHKITAIHPLYGWVVTEPYRLKQDMQNITDFEKLRRK